jgi:CarD family transcriptional regulator
MTKKNTDYAEGDWIVHLHHGVGQVQAIETKCVAGENADYYKVEAKDRTFWLPVERDEAKHIRPVATPSQLYSALKILKKPPEELESDYRSRQRQLKEVKSEGSLNSVCRIVRDLSARRFAKSLNSTEEKIFDFFKTILLREWSLSAEVSVEDARKGLRRLLKESRSQKEPA